MISQSDLKKLRKKELLQYLRNIVTICTKHDPEKLKLQSQVASMNNMVSQLDDSLLYDRAKALTDTLEILDDERDDAFTGFKHGLLMNALHKDLSKKEAAKLVLTHLESYGSGVTDLNYEAESTVLINVADDFETQKDLKAAIASLHLTEWVDRIQTDNDAFDEKYQERIELESKDKRPSFTSLRKEAKTQYSKLINRIAAFVELDEDGTYETLNTQLETLSERYQQIINYRKNDDDVEDGDDA